MNHLLRAGGLILAVLVVACGGDSNGPSDNSPTLAGKSSGTMGTGVFSATMTDKKGVVAGSAAIDVGALLCAPSISGTRTKINFVLTFTCNGFIPFTYTGTVTETTSTGVLQGSGFQGEGLTLTKQP
ncbi:MAG: hypothetical protein ABI679_09020 [Gemmatimonadota bacterium]